MKPPTPNLIATTEYWKPIKTKLSSILFFSIALSTIFILFILNSPRPFSINSKNQSSSILERYSNSSNPEQNVRANSPSSESSITSPPISPQLEETVTVAQPSSSGSVIDNNERGDISQPNEGSNASQAISSSKYSGNIEREYVTDESGDHSGANEGGDSTPVAEEIESQKNEACDLFEGKWVKDERGALYTNTTCPTLPDSKNCGKYGKDQGFVYWRWKPEGCELPRFDARMFLRIVRGKKLMFVGDSLARNMMESLLCLLSQAETPIDTYKSPNNKHRTFYFPSHNFTLMVIWTEFFVDSKEININGTLSSTINLDRINPSWAKKLQQASYAVISQGNWFGRKTYINKKRKPIGCVYCEGENMTNIRVPSAIRMVFKAAFKFINKCKKCEGLVTIMRTYSMGHFEDGSWLNGGYCNRTQPLREGDLRKDHEAWEIRRVQLEEMERAKREGNKRIELLDVTKAMMLRADGHPGRHWMVKDTNDCLHWCLPGPIDMWSELLLEILKKKS